MIPVFKPLLEQEEFDAARKALELGWLGLGSLVGEFETRLQTFLGVYDRHVVCVSTGHAALHLGLLLAGVGPGDEVIISSFNNAADFQAILAVGGEPVFCDIDDDSLCIDLDQADRLVSPRTKALIAMDYAAGLCDHDRVARFGRDHGLRVLHDAAHSFGSKYRGTMVGAFSDMTMFSFDPVKAITCIDGGALVVRTEEDMHRLHAMRMVGMTQPVTTAYMNTRAVSYDVLDLGFRYHLANLHAAIGLAQLGKIDTIAASRRRACRDYNRGLDRVSGVRTPSTDFTDVVPLLYCIRLPADRRDRVRAFLSERGIETGVHWTPGHLFTRFKHARRGDLSVTERVGQEILSLPLHANMAPGIVEHVIDGLRSFFHSQAQVRP